MQFDSFVKHNKNIKHIQREYINQPTLSAFNANTTA